MIKEAIIKLSKKEDLTYKEAETVMNEIMSGEATPVQMSAYLTALSLKGETIDEITASAVCQWQNTETGQLLPNPVQRMCWKH